MTDPLLAQDTPLTEASPAQLAAAVEANTFAMFRAMAQALGGDYEATPFISRYHTAPHSPIFKGAFAARFASEDANAAIEETIAWFKAHSAPFFFWWTGHDTEPADLGSRLLAHGLTMFEQDAPEMVADINRLDWDKSHPSQLRLEPVVDERRLQQWAQIFVQSFDTPSFAGQAWVDATLAVGIERAPWKLLVGTLAGDPVCCGLLYCGAGVAGLVGLGTLPAFRRRGIGSAMQLERLRIARELGYRYAVLFASAMGYSPYRKLGFQDTGRRISRYLWRNG